MITPADPAAGAPPSVPAAPGVASAPVVPPGATAATGEASTTPPVAGHDNPWDDPATARQLIESLRAENGRTRVNAKQAAADEARTAAEAELTAKFAQILGLTPQSDPAKLAEEAQAARASAEAEAKQVRVELAVFRAASSSGADPGALLDSRRFLDTIKGLDPNDAAGITAAIAQAVTDNPRLKAGSATTEPALPPVPATGASVVNLSGGTGSPQVITRESLHNMSPQAIMEAYDKGQLNHLTGAKS